MDTSSASSSVWENEWDMGISDEELIKICEEVMTQNQDEVSSDQPQDTDCSEEANFESLLDYVLDL